IENIIGVLQGTDPSLPAIALMAHSDSVPGSPGAADDAAGVSAVLEVVRALKAAGPHRRDVVVIITDGEEAGLLGARAFFASG
ncbi:M20/M25/M40 family metallo-hydrolase, partial [Acinetobacter baumannii]